MLWRFRDTLAYILAAVYHAFRSDTIKNTFISKRTKRTSRVWYVGLTSFLAVQQLLTDTGVGRLNKIFRSTEELSLDSGAL